MRRLESTLVVGLGNPLMTDDGIGLAALERLRESCRLPASVELLDGGTWGLRLLPDIEEAGRLLLLDAVDAGGAPGSVVVLEREELPLYLGRPASPHQVGVRDVLALAEFRGRLPRETVAMGIQPARVEPGTGLSREAEAALPRLVGRALGRLFRWALESRPAVAVTRSAATRCAVTALPSPPPTPCTS